MSCPDCARYVARIAELEAMLARRREAHARRMRAWRAARRGDDAHG